MPDENNGWKLEMFIFDVFPFARRLCVLKVDRASEFSPLKNATGDDSPETCRRDVDALHRIWLPRVAPGAVVPSAALVELSPLFSYEGEPPSVGVTTGVHFECV